ncbi:MAG: phenylacetate--CoA ligase family protein [Candidatus Jordarchaeum sp.]|uniref:phenylacetate--CoA ligase family protein n=1 Tax=Candidatus Jordarchaeum sp. TaxID=2823881 RepID=UPI00404ABE98
MDNGTNAYNPIIELMPRKELEQLQTNNLKRQLEYVYQKSEFYHKKFEKAGIKPTDIKTLADLKKIPVTTRPEIQEKIKETKDPHGGRLCTTRTEPLIAFSPEFPPEGEPIYLVINFKDAQFAVEILTRQLVMVGTTKNDRILHMSWSWNPINSFLSPVYNNYTNQAVGDILNCTILHTEEVGPDAPRALYTSKFFKPKTVIAPFMALIGVKMEAEKQNIPLNSLGFQVIVFRDRKELPKSEDKKIAEKEWSVKTQSMLDIQDNLFYAMDCPQHKGLHVWEDMYIAEATDPNTGEPQPPGKPGKLTITNLFAEAVPLIRYQTPIDCKIENDKCPCGRTHTRIIPTNY